MKKSNLLSVFCMTIFALFFRSVGYCQKNAPSPWDPALEANCDKWKLITRNKMFGATGKVEFGPYSVVSIEKLDSPFNKVKTIDGAELALDPGYDAWIKNGPKADTDLTRKMNSEKSAYSHILLAKGTDTTEIFSSLFSIAKYYYVKEKKVIFLPDLSDNLLGITNEENTHSLIGNMRVINGFILSNTDSVLWNFFFTSVWGDIIKNAQPDSSRNEANHSSNYIKGYLKNRNDSIHVSLVTSMYIYKLLGKYDTTYFDAGFELVNQKGQHLAAYKKKSMDYQSPYYIWMQKDLDNSYRRAIASFLAITRPYIK